MCALIDIGIGSSDFIDNELADFGTSVSHVPVTETEDWRGNKTLVFSGTSSRTVVLHKRTVTYVRDKEGIKRESPAYLMHKTGSTIKRGDKIVIGTGTESQWKVINVVGRPVQTPIFQYSDLYLWE